MPSLGMSEEAVTTVEASQLQERKSSVDSACSDTSPDQEPKSAPVTVHVSVGSCKEDRAPLFWLRIKAGLTTTDLQDLAGVSHQSILLYERGKATPGIDIAFRLAHVLGVTVDRLFGIPYKMQARDRCGELSDIR